jgi:hypothetical protein
VVDRRSAASGAQADIEAAITTALAATAPARPGGGSRYRWRPRRAVISAPLS